MTTPLYVVPASGEIKLCLECGRRIQYIPSPKTPGKWIPLSLDAAVMQPTPAGVEVRVAPSHFTDCTNPKRFSKKAR